MKSFGFLLVMALVLSSVAHADIPNDTAQCLLDENFKNQHRVECAFAATTMGPLLASATLSSISAGPLDKEAYETQLRDDAAAYVGSDGADAATVLLRDSIAQIRAQEDGIENVSDLQIAKMLMN